MNPFENQGTNNQGKPVNFNTVTFQRSYKDANGEWQNTATMRPNDLPRLRLILDKCFEELVLNDTNDE